MRINDPNGAERFGVSYKEDGVIGLGLDAPPGTGDDRNRERINLVADEKGGAWLSFTDFTQTPAVIRGYGLTGEETLRPAQ